MSDVASVLGSAPLQEVASVLGREASWLDPGSGGPLAPPQQVVPRAFEGPLSDGTTFLLGGWQRELDKLAADAHDLAARLKAAAEQLHTSGGLLGVPTSLPETAVTAITTWAQRTPGHLQFEPGGFSHASGGVGCAGWTPPRPVI